MRMGIGCWQSGDRKAAMLALVLAKQGSAQERRGVSRFGLQVDGPYPPEECVSNSPHSQSPACMLLRPNKGEKCRKTAECRSNSTSLL